MSDRNPLQTVESREKFFEALFTHLPGAVRYACYRYRYKVTQDELEDICQEVLIELIEDDYSRLLTFDHRKSSAKTWIYAVVKRYLAHQSRGDLIITSLEDIADHSLIYQPRQDTSILYKERWEAIQLALARLPKRSQILFELSCNGFSHLEISNLIGVKVNTIRKRRYDLIGTLKKHFTRKDF